MPYGREMRPDQIALQLYTVRALMATDLAGTLRAVTAAGYHSVELAGLPSTDPRALTRLLGEAGLRAVASHEGIGLLREDRAAVAARLREIGCPRVIVPWMPEENRRTLDDVRRFASELGQLAEYFAGGGIRLGYHNHAFEFAPLGDTTVWDVLLAELPANVDLELDVYWAAVAGRDPAALIDATAGRVRLLHMKDRAEGPEVRDVPAGEGTLAFPQIVEAGRAAGVEWYVAEQDDARDPLTDIAVAARYLESLAR
jgi:sugar phosphate isomerase/epimerase